MLEQKSVEKAQVLVDIDKDFEIVRTTLEQVKQDLLAQEIALSQTIADGIRKTKELVEQAKPLVVAAETKKEPKGLVEAVLAAETAKYVAEMVAASAGIAQSVIVSAIQVADILARMEAEAEINMAHELNDASTEAAERKSAAEQLQEQATALVTEARNIKSEPEVIIGMPDTTNTLAKLGIITAHNAQQIVPEVRMKAADTIKSVIEKSVERVNTALKNLEPIQGVTKQSGLPQALAILKTMATAAYEFYAIDKEEMDYILAINPTEQIKNDAVLHKVPLSPAHHAVRFKLPSSEDADKEVSLCHCSTM